ncbi:MAG: hypothetical protein AB7V50_02700 [Vampirovibrionia bacterium]
MNNIFKKIFANTLKFTLNCIVVAVSLFILIGIWNSKHDIFDYSIELTILVAGGILYFINKPPDKKVNDNNLNIALKQYSINLTHTAIKISEELNKMKLIENPYLYKTAKGKEHPINHCLEVIFEVKRCIPAKKSEEEIDTSGIKRVITEYIYNLEDNLKTMKEFTRDKDPVLLEIVQKTNIQLQKILEKETYLDYTLRSDVNKFLNAANETAEYIIRNYTSGQFVDDTIKKVTSTVFNDKK